MQVVGKDCLPFLLAVIFYASSLCHANLDGTTNNTPEGNNSNSIDDDLSNHTITEDLPAGEAFQVQPTDQSSNKPKSGIESSLEDAVNNMNSKFGVDDYLVKKNNTEVNNNLNGQQVEETLIKDQTGKDGDEFYSTDIERELNASGKEIKFSVSLVAVVLAYLLC